MGCRLISTWIVLPASIFKTLLFLAALCVGPVHALTVEVVAPEEIIGVTGLGIVMEVPGGIEMDVAHVDELDDGARVDGAAVLRGLGAGERLFQFSEVLALEENERGIAAGGAWSFAAEEAAGGVHCP